MKKKLSILFSLIAATVSAQNIQLHYDFGRDIYSAEEGSRPKMTATFEQFKADGLGSWFYFIDLDFTRKGVDAAYAEVSREFNLGKESPFAAHVEYNGGLSSGGGEFQPAALIGGAWNGHNADYSTTYSVQMLYKRYFKGVSNEAFHSAQLTGVWSTTFLNKAVTFSGYIDFWRDVKANGHGKLTIMGEPQLWYNVNPHLSFGTELEFSDNFVFNMANGKTFFVNPTLAAKWNF